MAEKTYNDGLEAAAQWHESKAAEAEEKGDYAIALGFSDLWRDFKLRNRDDAAAIRALKEPED